MILTVNLSDNEIKDAITDYLMGKGYNVTNIWLQSTPPDDRSAMAGVSGHTISASCQIGDKK